MNNHPNPLNTYEPAARAYCRAMGLDPDRSIGHGAEPDENGIMPMVLLSSPQWMLVARSLREHHAMNEALRLNPLREGGDDD